MGMTTIQINPVNFEFTWVSIDIIVHPSVCSGQLQGVKGIFAESFTSFMIEK